MSLKTVTSRRSMKKNARYVTRRVTKKRSDRINTKITEKIEKEKYNAAEEIYNDNVCFGDDALAWEN